MDPHEKRAAARFAARLSAEDLATLRALIATHAQRLQALDPEAMMAALEDAVFADVMANPSLAAALRRSTQAEILRKKRRAHLN